ncbi:NFX1-type zinc finger-containing protein 1-like [Lytechinus pictus]|uniref:NFX1-type zinc finger-containing protein 1-like n=1 Tax=Lytechinus pictus TaxID=7653 RepID=UPI0030B9ADF3
MTARYPSPCTIQDDNGSVVSDTESVSSISSSTTGKQKRPRNRNKGENVQLFGPKLTVQELNQLKRDERNLAIAMRARKPLLETLLLDDDIGGEIMAGLLDVLISVSKIGGDDAKEVYRFLASNQFIKVHLLLLVLKYRMKPELCSNGNILLKAINVLVAFKKLRCGSNESLKMVAAVIHDTIKYGLDIPQRKGYEQGLNDVRMILDKGKDGQEESTVDMRSIPIFPTAGEVADTDDSRLHDALADQGHSVKTYLECHFRLLREDIVQPLRAVISKYHQVKREIGLDATKRKCHIIDDVKLYEIITTHTSKGVTFRVQFNTSSLNNVSWETTRILSFGNMVCLTNNHFHDMVFATVAKRDPQWLKKGFVDLRLLRLEDTKLLMSGVQFFMFDSRKYVEESYEVLDAMQKINSASLPLVPHVVYKVAENELSCHLKKDPETQYDVGSLIKDEYTTTRSKPRTWRASLQQIENWPPIDQLCVDEYQLSAIQAALKNQLTVITGAPGTGKTHVGLKLTQLFVLNKDRWGNTRERNGSGPLLFMCASKATLDEYLTGVSFFQRTGIVRWAGQHTRKALQEYQLEHLREKQSVSTAYEDQLSTEKLEACKTRLGDVQANLQNLQTKIFAEEILKVVIDGKHFRKLKSMKKEKSHGVVFEWLLSDKAQTDDLQKLEENIPFNLTRFVCPDGDEGGWFEQNLPFGLDPLDQRISEQARNFVSKQLGSKDMMTDSESKKIEDVWKLPLQDRWRMYRLWASKLEARGRQRAATIFKEMEDICLNCQKMHDAVDETILSASSVIGMTTSSAAKNQRVLQRISPRVIIIEEGADVLQSITTVVISSGCQQLILIGESVPKVDQFQAVRKVAEIHGIHASLLQQLVDANYSVYELKKQHRMSPITSKLSRQLFKYEYDHDQSVIEKPSVNGIQQNVFLIDHNARTSVANYEASFLMELFSYLIGKGFVRKQISILISFSSQQDLFSKDVRDRILTVDNFRGGNDIVLFMSNASERASRPGCLLLDQRIAKVLSSARRGLYIIGNFSFLSSQSPMWGRIVKEARRLEWVDRSLKLTCPNHPDNPISVSSVDGFLQLKEKSGCGLPCQARLDCGHGCKELCHDHDIARGRAICRQPCNKTICENDHKCTRTCSEPCDTKCKEMMDKKLPCGHFQRLPCRLSPSHATCRDKCERLLSCGHKCTGICGNPCKQDSCVEKTTKSNWPCKHVVEVRCCDGPESCPEPCNSILACGHQCSGTCGRCRRGRLHLVCQQPCGRTLVCGHSCESNCAAQCPPCTKKCQNRCQHSECRKFCGEACIPCKEPCLWRCPHVSCGRLCGEHCDRKPCDEPCNKNLPCGHPCIGMCGERCPTKCRVCDRQEVTEILFGSEDEEDARFVQLEDCGHVIEVEALDHYMSITQESSDDVTIQLKGCPKCKTSIRRNLRYGNTIKQTLGDVENVKTKMRGSEVEIESKTKELRDKLSQLRSHVACRHRFIDFIYVQKLIGDLNQRKHLEKILARLNRCAFLRAIVDVHNKVSTGNSFTFQLKTRKHGIEVRLRELKNEVTGGELDKFTDQQMNDIQREVSRVSVQVEAMAVLTRNMTRLSQNMNSCHLKALDKIVDKASPFTVKDEAQATQHLRQFKREMGQVALGITDRERVQIIKAIGLSQGHWYKCPKGHVYAIGECGGAMEETKCPECGSHIGGGSHRLTSGNRVATEMDGATRAAWPTGAFGYEDYEEEEEEYEPEELEFDQEDIEEQFEIERQIREDQAREERRMAENVRQERERLAAGIRARLERDRLAAENRARQERERFAAENWARQLERDRLAAENRTRQERERLAAENRTRQERERLAAENRTRQERERLAAENRTRQERERLAAEDLTRQFRRLAAEREAQMHARNKSDEKCIIS